MANNLLLWIRKSEGTTFVKMANKYSPLENGGVLMGYFTPSKNEAVVTKPVGPGPEAEHSSHGFCPDNRFHTEEIEETFRKDRRIIYIGDWHSHPNGNPNLSPRDKKTLKNISSYPASRLPNPVMLILYGDPDNWNYAAYQLFKEKRWWGTKYVYVPLQVKFFD